MSLRSAGILFAASLALTAARPDSSALKGVWLSIESPVNPYVDENRGIVLMVHTFWMRGPAGMALEGRAEGSVNGQRQTVNLSFQDRGDGVYALPQSWPAEGRWALVITARNRGQQASALVRLSDDRKVADVRVTPDRTVAEADVVAALN